MRRIHSLVAIAALTCVLPGCSKPTTKQPDQDKHARHNSQDRFVEAETSRLTSVTNRDKIAPRADRYLQSVFARYRNAASYRDRGSVRLSYVQDGTTQTQDAPLRIWFDRNRLYVHAYDVRIWSDSEGIGSWIRDEATLDYDSQVLRLPPISGRPSMERLLSDPILLGRLSGGLAGPPPQLEWLLSAHPMRALFAERHEFSEIGERSIAGRPCRGIEVKVDQEIYRFWIDAELQLIRRVELPPVLLPVEAGREPQSMELTLELSGATFDAPETGPDFERLPDSPRLVRQFIGLPGPPPSDRLGQPVKPFRVGSSASNVVLTERGTDRDLTLVMRYGGDPVCRQQLAILQGWLTGLSADVRDRMDVCALVDPGAATDFPAGGPVMGLVDTERVASGKLAMPAGGLIMLDASSRVLWVEDRLNSASLPAIGAVVSDLLHGVDVPERRWAQWRQQQQAYQQALGAATVSGN